MENFEEIIKQFVEKKVNKNNPAIVEYKPVFKKKVITIDLQRVVNRQRKIKATIKAIEKRFYVVGPDGTGYESMMDASKQTGISYFKMRDYCNKEQEGWKIVKMET